MLLELSSHLLLGDEARERYIADFGIATINEFGICREVFDIADMVVLHQFRSTRKEWFGCDMGR